jgi:hypothetical protein
MLPFQDDLRILAAVVRRERKASHVFHPAQSISANILGVHAGPWDAFFMPIPGAKVHGKFKRD